MVFVSHSTKDDSTVNRIRQTLEWLGVEVWTDSQRLTAGDALTPTVMGEIENCDHFLAVLSTNAINSPWVANEIRHALGHKKKVIPVLLPPIQPSALPLWFAEEPVGLKLSIGPGGLAAALPDLLAALGLRQPTEKVDVLRAQLLPIADLILKLTDPSIDISDGKRHPAAAATLIYSPPDGGPEVESRRYRFIAPLGLLEADDRRLHEQHPEPAVREGLARALSSRANHLEGANRLKEAAELVNELRWLHEQHSEPALREQLASALSNRAYHLARANRLEEAAELVNELRRLHEQHSEPAVREQLARALSNRAYHLAGANRLEEAGELAREYRRLFPEDFEQAISKLLAPLREGRSGELSGGSA